MVDTQENSGLTIWTAQSHFTAGQTLKGAVCLDTSTNPGESITLYLRGFDDSISWSRYIKNKRRFLQKERKENQFFEIKLPLVDFDAKNCPKAKTAFPFSIVLPEDLAQSVVSSSTKIKGLQGRVRYVLSALLHQGAATKMLSEQDVDIYRPVQTELFK